MGLDSYLMRQRRIIIFPFFRGSFKFEKQNLFILLITAGTAMWNMGVVCLAGLILYYGLQRRWFKV